MHIRSSFVEQSLRALALGKKICPRPTFDGKSSKKIYLQMDPAKHVIFQTD